MGAILRPLFGGSKQTSSSQSESGNKAFDMLSGELRPALEGGVNSLGQLTDILGKGFEDYKKNAGFDFALNRGQQGITGSAAARGLMNSGSTQKALASFETGLGQQTYDNWLNQLGKASQTGLSAANTIAGAGQYSNSSAQGKGVDSGKGILGTLFG